MEKEPRKASEVLLELENKIDVTLGLIRSQDLNIKILSNKLNSLLEAVNSKSNNNQKIIVEAVDVSASQKPVTVSSEFNIKLDEAPNGFRRTSRPETFAGDDAYLSQNIKYPVQIPKAPPGREPENIIVPKEATSKAVPNKEKIQSTVQNENSIPVTQRVVNSHGKSLFLAEVEILSLPNMQSVSKTRTNGIGKWSAPLGIGDYRVIIHKFETSSKEKLESIQDIRVDGSQSPYELSAIIIKSKI